MFDYLKDELINFISKKKSASFFDIVKYFRINPSNNKNFSIYLNKLKDQNIINFSKKKNSYYIPEFIGEFEAEYDLNSKNFPFCFVEINNEKRRVSLFNFKKINALKNDLVLIDVYKSFDWDDAYCGYIKSIIKRKNKFIYAQVKEDLSIDTIYFNQKIEFNYDKSLLKPNTYVKFKIEEINDSSVNLKLEKEINAIDEPYSDLNLIVDYFEVDNQFNEKTIEEASKIPNEVENKNSDNRIDLTDQLIVTIDGEKTKDFDDAISVKKTKNETFILGVHIADVAYYVKEDSELDKQALSRGTSIYTLNKVIPMLPEKLSNGICSLNPNVDRFTLTLEAEIDKHGKTLWTKLYPSCINSKYRLTYKQVNNYKNENVFNENCDLKQMIEWAFELSKILSQKKYNEGYIDFEISEPIISVDENGKAIGIEIKERLDSEILIENFMVFANEEVATKIFNLKIPSIYRIHEIPSEEKVENLKNVLKALKINDIEIKTINDSKTFQNIVTQIKKERFDELIKINLLRTMQKAIYSSDNIGHFGLASQCYSHFTSPIRRYPDLLLHRIIWNVIFKNDHDWTIKNKERIAEIAKHSSKKEEDAVVVERKINDIKKAELYSALIGQIKVGTIVSIQRFGMFIEYEDQTNSLVHISTLTDSKDFDVSDDNCYLTIKDKVYKIGDRVKTKIVSINKIEGKIDSIIVE